METQGMYLNLPGTIHRCDLPHAELEREYIYTLYRRTHQPWYNYVLSMFQRNNECCNIWTHFLASIWIIHKTLTLFRTRDLLNDPEMYPLGAGLIAMSCLFVASTTTHYFSDITTLGHYTVYFVDYMGISIYGIGATFLTHNYCVRESLTFLDYPSVQVSVCLNLTMMIVFCYCKIQYGRSIITKLAKFCTNLLAYSWFLVPLVERMLYKTVSDRVLQIHYMNPVMYVVAGTIYKLHIPERWYPETFDFIGQSHQLWHIGIWALAYITVEGVLQDIEVNTQWMNNRAHRPVPTILGTYGIVLGIIVIESVLLILFHKKIKKKLLTAKKQQKDSHYVHKKNFGVNNNNTAKKETNQILQ